VRDTFKGELYTQYHNDSTRKFAEKEGLKALPGAGHHGLGRDKLHHGSNSGYQAIGLAYLLAKEDKVHPRIILLGFDMGRTGGKNHFFGDHPKGFTNGQYANFVPRFSRLAEDLASEGVEVINCTRQSNLNQFPKMTLEQVYG